MKAQRYTGFQDKFTSCVFRGTSHARQCPTSQPKESSQLGLGHAKANPTTETRGNEKREASKKALCPSSPRALMLLTLCDFFSLATYVVRLHVIVCRGQRLKALYKNRLRLTLLRAVSIRRSSLSLLCLREEDEALSCFRHRHPLDPGTYSLQLSHPILAIPGVVLRRRMYNH